MKCCTGRRICGFAAIFMAPRADTSAAIKNIRLMPYMTFSGSLEFGLPSFLNTHAGDIRPAADSFLPDTGTDFVALPSPNGGIFT